MSIKDVQDTLRHDASIRGLRRRVEMLARLRDEAERWSADEYDYLAGQLMAYTDAVLHELAKREWGEEYVPYPHPAGTLEEIAAHEPTEGGA